MDNFQEEQELPYIQGCDTKGPDMWGVNHPILSQAKEGKIRERYAPEKRVSAPIQ